MNSVLSSRSLDQSHRKAKDKIPEFTGLVVRIEGERRVVSCVGKEWSFSYAPFSFSTSPGLAFLTCGVGCCSKVCDQAGVENSNEMGFSPLLLQPSSLYLYSQVLEIICVIHLLSIRRSS